MEYEDYCSVCGFALTNEECAVNIEGTIVDFLKKDRGAINMTLCRECWSKVFEVHSGGLEPAIARSEGLRKDNLAQTNEIKKLRKEWKDRDDEGGGVTARLPPT